MYELAISNTREATGSIDTDDPKLAEISFFYAPIAIGIHQSVHQGSTSLAVLLASITPIALCLF
jgi:hypothetical protein